MTIVARRGIRATANPHFAVYLNSTPIDVVGININKGNRALSQKLKHDAARVRYGKRPKPRVLAVQFMRLQLHIERV